MKATMEVETTVTIDNFVSAASTTLGRTTADVKA
jgi:hypothetical protein